MPSVPGILQLVCMMFSPRVELRVDQDVTKYTGLLCGCGTIPRHISPTSTPVHPDNDMEIVFDTEIDDQDIDKINLIRYHINSILRNMRSVNKSQFHKQLRTEIINLLKRPRKTVDEEIWAQEEYVWDRICSDFIDPNPGFGMTFCHDDIFQPHFKVRRNQRVVEEVHWDGPF